ncbi:putative Zn-binding protein involved in type VI secretion [Oxalobacteraceae bacterium GrIS 1.11]
MSQPLIVLGDKTSHGGTVIGCTIASATGGKPIARQGDMVSCPKCKGVFPIAQGDASLIIDGAPAAYHSCKVACGAVLLSSQVFTTTVPASGAAPGAGGDDTVSLAQRFGSVGAGLAAAYEDEPLDEHGQRFQGRFQLISATDGQPVSGQSARVRSTGGQYLTGSTDAEGYTQWVERDATEALAFDLTDESKP